MCSCTRYKSHGSPREKVLDIGLLKGREKHFFSGETPKSQDVKYVCGFRRHHLCAIQTYLSEADSSLYSSRYLVYTVRQIFLASCFRGSRFYHILHTLQVIVPVCTRDGFPVRRTCVRPRVFESSPLFLVHSPARVPPLPCIYLLIENNVIR